MDTNPNKMSDKRGRVSEGHLLLEAVHLRNLDAIRKLVGDGVFHEDAFLLNHTHDFKSNVSEFVGVWEALLFSGHPLPAGDHKIKLLDCLSDLPEKHWERTLPLLKKIFKDPNFFVESDLDHKPEKEYSLPIRVAHQLLHVGNLEAIKALVPLSITEKEIQRWYRKTNNVNMQSFPYQIFDDLNQEKLAILDYLLQVFPEHTWQKIGTIEGGLKTWFPLVSKAAQNGDITLVKWLIERGCSLNDPGLLEYNMGISINPITLAVQSEHSSIVFELLDLGCSVNTIHTESQSPLLMVIERHYQIQNFNEMVQTIVSKGADLEFHSPYAYSSTALCSAAQRNLHETVKLLIDKGADLEASGKRGQPPLELACLHNNLESFIHLYKAGASYEFTKCASGEKVETTYNIIDRAPAPIRAWVENYTLENQTQPARSKHRFKRL